MAVNSFMQNAKCPIVLISTGERPLQSQELQLLQFLVCLFP